MEEAQLVFVWPGLVDAIPALIGAFVFPLWLMWIVFKHMPLSVWKKILLIPFCFVGPFLITAFWPLALKLSGVIGFTGPGNYQPPYEWYVQIFGRFSNYVWFSLTGLAILAFNGAIKSKATHPSSKPDD